MYMILHWFLTHSMLLYTKHFWSFYPPRFRLIYTIFHWSILPSFDLYYPTMIYTILHTTLHRSILPSIDLCYTLLIYITLQWSHTTLHWSILPSIDLYYPLLIFTTLFWSLPYPWSTLTVAWATQTYIFVMCIKTQILTIKCSLNWSTYILHLDVHLYSSL